MIDLANVHSAADAFRLYAERTPDAIALIHDGRETTYAELRRRAAQVGNGLITAGITPQSRIGFLGKNSDRYFEVLGGALMRNGVLVAVNTRLAAPEVQYILADAEAEILFVGQDFYAMAAQILPELPKIKTVIAMDGGHGQWPDFDSWRAKQSDADCELPHAPHDDVIQLYTSGTTGHPKGVQNTNENYVSLFAQANGAGWADMKPGGGNLVVMPLFHVAGVNCGMIGLVQGAVNVIMKDVDPAQILTLIERHRIETVFMVPAVILFVLQQPAAATTDFSSLRLVMYGASPIAQDLLERAQKAFGCGFVQLYGLTETLGGATCLPPEDHDPARGKLRSCGKAHPGADIRIFDADGTEMPVGEVGEIVIRSKSVMKGYWNNQAATEKSIRDGWFYSGDAGYRDAEGYFFIHDRVKDMIVSGGENIYPAEVENALFGHPSIADVAVIGVPDEKWGEAVKAIVVLKPGQTGDEQAIREYARTRIAGYKVPKSVDFIEALLRNPSGKILRRELRKPYWEGRTRMVN